MGQPDGVDLCVVQYAVYPRQHRGKGAVGGHWTTDGKTSLCGQPVIEKRTSIDYLKCSGCYLRAVQGGILPGVPHRAVRKQVKPRRKTK